MRHAVSYDHIMPVPAPSPGERFEQYIGEGISARVVALCSCISTATGERWTQLFRRLGKESLAVTGIPACRGKFELYADVFLELILQNPDICLFKLWDVLTEAHG